MEEVNVDVLVIGDIVCSSNIRCISAAHIACAGNTADIKADHIPDSIIAYGIKYILRDAIVMDAEGKGVNINSLFAPKGKAVLASGIISAKGLTRENKKDERQETDNSRGTATAVQHLQGHSDS